MPYAVAERPTL